MDTPEQLAKSIIDFTLVGTRDEQIEHLSDTLQDWLDDQLRERDCCTHQVTYTIRDSDGCNIRVVLSYDLYTGGFIVTLWARDSDDRGSQRALGYRISQEFMEHATGIRSPSLIVVERHLRRFVDHMVANQVLQPIKEHEAVELQTVYFADDEIKSIF